MLGWSGTVSHGEIIISHWESSLGWGLESYIETGEAEVVSLSGGYPDMYRIRASVMKGWAGDKQGQLDLTWVYKKYGLFSVNRAVLDALPDDEVLDLEVWDQS